MAGEANIGGTRILAAPLRPTKTALTPSALGGLAGIEDRAPRDWGISPIWRGTSSPTSGSDHTIILRGFCDAHARRRRSKRRLPRIALAKRASAYYAPDIIARIPVDDLDRDWREASAAMAEILACLRRIRRGCSVLTPM